MTFKICYALPALTLPILLSGCGQITQPAASPAVPVITTTVESTGSDSAQTDTYTGIVKPHKQVDIAFRISGYVASLLTVTDKSGARRPVQEGDVVSSGAVLARLNDVDYRAQAEASAAQSVSASENIDQAKSRLIQAAAARQQATYSVTEARTALAAALAQQDQAVAAQNEATDATANAQTQVNLAREAYQRANTLFQSGSATKPVYDEAKAAYDSAQTALQASAQAQKQAQAKVSEAEAQIKAARARIEEAQSGVESAKASVAAGEAAELAAESQANQARASQTAQNVPLTETAITAPFTGVVLARSVEVGSLAAPAVPAFVLADTSKFDIVFGLPEPKARDLHVGQSVDIDVHGRRHGVISEISPTSDPKSGVVNVQVTITGSDSSVQAGMTASLILKDNSASVGQFTIPLSALVPSKDHPDGFSVYVVLTQDGQSMVKLHDIQIIGSQGDNIIIGGTSLPKDSVIVASAPGLLYDGETVKVEDRSPEADNGLR